jgi:hypothetical protein
MVCCQEDCFSAHEGSKGVRFLRTLTPAAALAENLARVLRGEAIAGRPEGRLAWRGGAGGPTKHAAEF